MITTIETTPDIVITTTTTMGGMVLGLEYCLRKPPMAEWEWHEAVARHIANHHASMMGKQYPCPEAQSPPEEDVPFYDNPPPVNSPLNRELRVAYMNNQPHPMLDALKAEIKARGGDDEVYRKMTEEALGLRLTQEFVSTQLNGAEPHSA
jgi:hypothetical protein